MIVDLQWLDENSDAGQDDYEEKLKVSAHSSRCIFMPIFTWVVVNCLALLRVCLQFRWRPLHLCLKCRAWIPWCDLERFQLVIYFVHVSSEGLLLRFD